MHPSSLVSQADGVCVTFRLIRARPDMVVFVSCRRHGCFRQPKAWGTQLQGALCARQFVRDGRIQFLQHGCLGRHEHAVSYKEG